MVERQTVNLNVTGSRPVYPAKWDELTWLSEILVSAVTCFLGSNPTAPLMVAYSAKETGETVNLLPSGSLGALPRATTKGSWQSLVYCTGLENRQREIAQKFESFTSRQRRWLSGLKQRGANPSQFITVVGSNPTLLARALLAQWQSN